MKKIIMIVGCILAVLAAGIYYYITLPAINIHSVGFWWFIISILGVIFLWRLIRVNFSNFRTSEQQVYMERMDAGLSVKITGGLLVLALAVFFIGSVLGSPIINASRYQKLLTVENGNFAQDVEQADYNTIPLLDRNSASSLQGYE